jgi:alpha-glucosidase
MQGEALVTRDARNTPWNVLVALSANGTATGDLYLDDGESVSPPATLFVNLEANGQKLTAQINGAYKDKNALSSVTILGVKSAPSAFTLNGKKVGSVKYNSKAQSVALRGLSGATSGGAWAADWVLEWS